MNIVASYCIPIGSYFLLFYAKSETHEVKTERSKEDHIEGKGIQTYAVNSMHTFQ